MARRRSHYYRGENPRIEKQLEEMNSKLGAILLILTRALGESDE